MRFEDHDTLLAEARPEPPFSNADEGYGWIGANCATCWHDRGQRQDRVAGPGCPLLLIVMEGRTPRQWLDQKEADRLYSRAGQYVCTEYRPEGDGPTEPQPVPTPDGQGELLPREPFEGHRMFTTAPDLTAAVAATED